MRVSVLADSRGFDTYYVNSRYVESYGYHETFPYLLSREFAAEGSHELVHIPDHYRGGTVQNNIIRLALTNPELIVLVNGIWETLLTREMFLDYVKGEIGQKREPSGEPLDFSFSGEELVRLFLADKLANSPAKYIERERRICSFFLRRGRGAVVFGLPVTPPHHLDGIHFAGNYRCLPGWGRCLEALNAEMQELSRVYGCRYFDTDALMGASGGASECLIDQWHFSRHFHREIARHLRECILGMPVRQRLSGVQQKYFMPGVRLDDACLVLGTGEAARDWVRSHPEHRVVGYVVDGMAGDTLAEGIPLIGIDAVATTAARVIVLPDGHRTPWATEAGIAAGFCAGGGVLLYPDEMDELSNPVGRGADG